MGADIGIILSGFIIKLLLAVIGVVAGRSVLKRMDAWADFDFKEWINNANDNAKAQYLGYRILAVFILMAWILS